MGSKGPYHHGGLRESILNLARLEIENSGLESLSLRSLAQKAGVSKTAPYRHFSGIDEVLSILAAETMEELALAMEVVLDRTPQDQDALEALCECYIEFALARPKLFRFLFSLQGVHLGSPACFAAGNRAKAALAKALLRMGIPEDEDLGLLVSMHWAYVHGLSTLILEGLIDPQEYRQKAGEFLSKNPLGRMGHGESGTRRPG